ncbi:synaptopodin 2-like protein [Sardina pilchardus]|uniref:synaptopodin 2-like protein n=1 Tax=Sardina pilchardus TaxID=27697 RepID=UPI002E1221CC
MEARGHEPIRRGVSWGGVAQGPGAGPGSLGYGRGVRQGMGQAGTSPTTNSCKRDDHSWVKGKQAVTPPDSQLGRKTNLSRSASLSEKELKEARTRSQIIAAQLSVPSNSRGVQLFNRRRQRVNAFTKVSFGEGGGGGEGESEEGGEGVGIERESKSENFGTSPRSSEATWENKRAVESEDRDLNRENSQAKLPWSSSGALDSNRGNIIMEDQGESAIREVEDVDGAQERHFLPVKEKEEEEDLSVEPVDELRDEMAVRDDSNRAGAGQGQAKVNGAFAADSAETPGEMPNGCHDAPSKPFTPVAAQPPSTIVNRTARPFFSPCTVQRSPASSPAMDIPPAPSYSTPPLPAFPEPPTPTYAVEPPPGAFSEPPRSGPPRPTFSPPPPAPSYPTPPLPSYSSPPPLAMMPGPSPGPPPAAHYIPQTAPKPTYIPQMLAERPRSQTPIRTGILDEGVVKRNTRKSMFTFQEKPKIAPNPELLSLVQGVDEKKKQRPAAMAAASMAENVPEEELLALGAEASNFLAKEEEEQQQRDRVVENAAPAWSSSLKSSRTAARAEHKPEHKPEQALTNAAGKGAELFAKRQSRMEKYVLDNTTATTAASRRDGQIRSPSPTMSLPPSWVYQSNRPGRVKAIANASNVSVEISKTLKAQQQQQQQASQRRNFPAYGASASASPAPPAPAALQSTVLENGCTRMEMELSRHQPYQLNSSLFILNPAPKDPMSSLPRGAPLPPRPVVGAAGSAYGRQTSLPSPNVPTQFSSPVSYRPACFSPPLPLSPREFSSPVAAFAPDRVASPRSNVQAPRPTFSARKAGIEAQTKKETPATPTASRTPTMTRRFSSPEGPTNLVWSPTPSITSAPSPRPIHRAMTTSPVSPLWETRCQSPVVSQDTKANHRLLAKNIINAAKRKNSPSPGTLSGHGLPISPPGGGSGGIGGGILSFEHKPLSPFQPRSLGSQSPTFTSPPPTPTHMIRSPVRLYNTRSLTDSDASVESEDSGMRSPGVRTYNTCPRGWGGSLRIKRGNVSADL